MEELIGRYWELAYIEGKTGESHGTEANEILHLIRTEISDKNNEITALRAKVDEQAVHIERLQILASRKSSIQWAEQTAHIERLKNRLEYVANYIEEREDWGGTWRLVEDILPDIESTPAQSLAAFRAKVLEEVAEFVGRNLYDAKTYAEELRRMAKGAK